MKQFVLVLCLSMMAGCSGLRMNATASNDLNTMVADLTLTLVERNLDGPALIAKVDQVSIYCTQLKAETGWFKPVFATAPYTKDINYLAVLAAEVNKRVKQGRSPEQVWIWLEELQQVLVRLQDARDVR